MLKYDFHQYKNVKLEANDQILASSLSIKLKEIFSSIFRIHFDIKFDR